jgi:hypothetical protein
VVPVVVASQVKLLTLAVLARQTKVLTVDKEELPLMRLRMTLVVVVELEP